MSGFETINERKNNSLFQTKHAVYATRYCDIAQKHPQISVPEKAPL